MILAPTNRRVIRPYDKPSFEHTQRYGLIRGHPFGPAGSLVFLILMNEGSGNKVFDLSGNGNTGTLQGDTHFVPGKFGSALDFDGVDDYIDCGGADSLKVTSKFTISLWVKLNAFTTEIGWGSRIVWFNEDDTNSFQLFSADAAADLEADGFFVKATPGGVVKQIASIGQVTGQWYHVVATFDGTNIHLYIDGIISEGGTIDGDPGIGTVDNLRIGRRNDATGRAATNCQIDNVMIFNRALTPSEIALLYREPFCMVQKKAAPVYFFVLTDGVVYQELNLTVTADASVAEIDAHQMMDTGKAVQADANVSESDVHQIVETEKVVSADTSVSESDIQQMVDTGKEVSVDASVLVADVQTMIETDKSVEAAASIICTDLKVVFELNLAVSASGVVVATDAHTMIETGKSVTVIASPAVIDTQAMVETEVGISAEGSVSCVDTMGLLAHIAAFMILRQCTT